jgi:GNAT superfamily N-acetyltransferase
VDGFSIDYLEHRSEVIDEVAGWVWREWGFASLAACAADLRRSRRGTVPSRFLAVGGGAPVGIVNLIACNLPPRCDLMPWLAGLYVHPEHRRGGIGAALVRFCEAEAAMLGFRRLYLYTEHAEGFYGRLGWVIIDSAVWQGQVVPIMVRHIGRRTVSSADRARLPRCSGRRGG